MADFNKAVELNPDFARAYNNRAYVYYQQKEFNKAKEDVQRAQALKFTVDPELMENLRRVAVKKN
jgi:Flp pilus assembly protein TadD